MIVDDRWRQVDLGEILNSKDLIRATKAYNGALHGAVRRFLRGSKAHRRMPRQQRRMALEAGMVLACGVTW